MALDIYGLDNNEFLFAVQNRPFTDVTDVFTMFAQWTGLVIDEYEDCILTIENRETLICVIDKYMEVKDLNANKKKISTVPELKGLLAYFRFHKTDLHLSGD